MSCSQHFKTSRGRSGGGLPPPPPPSESASRRRGPPRRSSSNINCDQLSSRHLPVKVRSVKDETADILIFIIVKELLENKKTSNALSYQVLQVNLKTVLVIFTLLSMNY